jgi:hypothetical protein
MSKMVVTHSVVNVDTWLQFKSERADAMGAMEARPGRDAFQGAPGSDAKHVSGTGT